MLFCQKCGKDDYGCICPENIGNALKAAAERQAVTTRPEVKAAVEWWITQLVGPAQYECGEHSATMDYAVGLALMGRQPPPTEEQIEKFRVALAERMEAEITKLMAHIGGGRFRLVTRVDYEPDQILEDALEATGNKRLGNNLPWKTRVIVSPGEVKAAAGYGGPFEVIYQQEAKP